MSDPSLEILRRRIAETDQRLLDAVADRLEVAREIGRRKRAEGLPLRDYSVEREVVDRWIARLDRARVSAERAEGLVRWMIEEATIAQESLPGSPPRPTERSDVVVVGGLGQMGYWMSEFFRAAGHSVTIVDPRPPAESFPFRVRAKLREAVDGADLIVIATPMRVAAGVYQELREVGSRATIFDILSVKAPVVPAIHAGVRAGLSIASAHPLFGPGTRSLFGRNLIVLDCGDRGAADRVEAIFTPTALRITRLPLETHDALMSDVLGLPHLVSLLFARTLQHGTHSPSELGRGATTSFRRLLEVSELVARENPELVGDIQTLNPDSADLLRRLQGALVDLARAVESGESARYAALLGEGRKFLERSTAAT